MSRNSRPTPSRAQLGSTENTGQKPIVRSNVLKRLFDDFDPHNNARMIEARFYTDVHITGDRISAGPLTFLNTVCFPRRGEKSDQVRPSVLVRIVLPFNPTLPQSWGVENSYAHYHGGDFTDEIAALMSILWGVRLQAGPIDRQFGHDNDPLGSVHYWDTRVPVLPQSRSSAMIPTLTQSVRLEDLRTFPNLRCIPSGQCASLIKAARLYQQAVWLSDADPASSWLLLVSAIETAAGSFSGPNITASDDALSFMFPELHQHMVENELQGLFAPLMDHLTKTSGSTRKFRDFILNFSKTEPKARPEHQFQRVSFVEKDLRKSLNVIYGHRSRHTHEGVGFPGALCTTPSAGPEGIYEEKPTGLAVHTQNASWKADALPMHLFVFEHLVRDAILSWSRTL